MKPFLKWVGGKTKLLPELLKRVPKDIDVYYEPFAGGAALFFALIQEVAEGKRKVKRFELNDANEELIRSYYGIKHDVNRVIAKLNEYSNGHCEEHYYYVRKQPLDDLDSLVAARMIYLNKTGYNGLYRVNKSGGFNTPSGKHKKFTPDADNLREVSKVLQTTVLTNLDWKSSVSHINKNDFVYFDSPYVPVSKTANFTSYTVDGFDRQDQIDLALFTHKLDKTDRMALLSNADTVETRKTLYDGLKIESVSVARSINSDGAKRGKVGEILVSTSALHAELNKFKTDCGVCGGFSGHQAGCAKRSA